MEGPHAKPSGEELSSVSKSHKDTRPRQRKARGSGAEQGMESRLWGHGRVIKDSLSATNEWL